MEIISKLVKINVEFPVNNEIIEAKLNALGIIPLRWAIVNVDCNTATISVACENLC